MKKVMTIGGAMRDVFILYEHPEMVHMHSKGTKRSFITIEEGKKIEVQNLAYHTGGGATNSAVSQTRLGLQVESFFKIGNDQEGEFILQHMKKEQVSVDHVAKSQNTPTGTSFIIPSESGNRAVLVYRGANLTLEEKEVPFEVIDPHHMVYITSLSGQASALLPTIAHYAKQRNILVVTNPGTTQLTQNIQSLQDALPCIDILILNSLETHMLMSSLLQDTMQNRILRGKKFEPGLPPLLRAPIGPEAICFTLEHYFSEVISRGPRIVVVTNGQDGVYACDGNSIYYYPSIRTEVVSTLGCGDAFGSTFASQLLQGVSIGRAMQAGVLNASAVLHFLDTQTGLLTKQQLNKLQEAQDLSKLQIFSFK